jgi:hypothetical protein
MKTCPLCYDVLQTAIAEKEGKDKTDHTDNEETDAVESHGDPAVSVHSVSLCAQRSIWFLLW